MSKMTDVFWCDLDPKELVEWSRVVDAAIIVSNVFQKYSKAKPPTISFSGGRGFHVRGYLKYPMDVNQTRDEVIKLLNREAVPKIPGSTTNINYDPSMIRLDVSTLKDGGSIRAQWSLNAKTGLVDADTNETGKGMAELEKSDFTIQSLMSRKASLSRVAQSLEEMKPALDKLVKVAIAHGFKIYAVGGSVRDKLMGKEPHDIDLVVDHPKYGQAASLELGKIAKAELGAEFGEFTNQNTLQLRVDGIQFDLAVPRTETYSETSRKPTVSAGTITDDAMRRDFTINALYEDLTNPSPKFEDRIIDPTGKGMEDIKNHVLRSPEPEKTFLDDPLRMLRAIRFYGKTGFALDPVTEQKLREALPFFKENFGTEKMSAERFQQEFEKTLSGAHPGKAFKMMTDYGITEHVMPEWQKMRGLKHDTPHHLEDVDVHTEMVMDAIDELGNTDIAVRLAALLHDIGKPQAKGVGDQIGTFLNHEDIGAEMAEEILIRLKFPRVVIDRVKFIVQHHMRPHGYKPEWTDKAVRKFVREMGNELQSVLQLAEADATGRQVEDPAILEQSRAKSQELRQRIQEVQEKDKGVDVAKIKPPLNGHELQQMFGKGPGPWIKEVLEYLTDMQMENPALTKEEAAAAAKSFMAAKETPLEPGMEQQAGLGRRATEASSDGKSDEGQSPASQGDESLSQKPSDPAGDTPTSSEQSSVGGPSSQGSQPSGSSPRPYESVRQDPVFVKAHEKYKAAYQEAIPELQKLEPGFQADPNDPMSSVDVHRVLHDKGSHGLVNLISNNKSLTPEQKESIHEEHRLISRLLQGIYPIFDLVSSKDSESLKDKLWGWAEVFKGEGGLSSSASFGRVSYIVHMPGHKNSKGEEAPYVIKSHETGKILSSHKTREEAKRHLQQMHAFASRFEFDPNSTENEGRWRISDPKKFDQSSFRRWKTWSGVTAPEGVTFIVGETDKGNKALQAVRFDLELWDEDKAGDWWSSISDNPGFTKTWNWTGKSKSFLGASGFSHDSWQDGFYPEAVKREDRLRHYADKLPSVEISTTFHSIPPIRVFQNWAGMVPDGFKFALRAPHKVHPSGMWSGGEVLMNLFMKYARILGDKLGPVVVHIPKWESYKEGDAGKFFSLLPTYRYAVQIDSEAWRNDEVLKEMLMRGHVVVATESSPTVTDGMGWSYYRIAAEEAEKMKSILDGAVNPNYVFVTDKGQTFPSKEFLKLLEDYGLNLSNRGLTSTPSHGPNLDPQTGPANSGSPSGSSQADENAEPLAVSKPPAGPDESEEYGKKRETFSPTISYPDLEKSDGDSNPLGDQIDGSTNKT